MRLQGNIVATIELTAVEVRDLKEALGKASRHCCTVHPYSFCSGCSPLRDLLRVLEDVEIPREGL